MLIKKYLYIAAVSVSLFACSADGEGGEVVPSEPSNPAQPTERMPIDISTSITRATETAFESGDQIGLFVVNRNADGTLAALQPVGNHVDNMLYTYSDVWTPATPVYWKDDRTCADFYMYYPYRNTVSSVSAMPFDVAADQSTASAYKAADLLVGSTLNVAPKKQAVGIVAKHVMSQVEIVLKAGNGFTDASLASAEVSLRLNDMKTSATVDLSTAAVTATGTASSLTPYKDGGTYRAIVVPQKVEIGNLITVTVDGTDYNLKKAFTFTAGKRHTFTVTLAKTGSGIDVSIGAWDVDDTDNGGTATGE
ncbi:MAG: fimbrillin family protein [Prevotella sp.]|nr:fimbrillin family protein [Prevotella sp.]